MKTKIICIILALGITSILLPNPIDISPVAKFSELAFDENGSWKMELYFPFAMSESHIVDSIIVEISRNRAFVTERPDSASLIQVITPGSLSIPLKMNPQGDTVMVYTHSSHFISQVRIDGLIFGSAKGASVGQPIDGFSIMRNSWRDQYHNDISIDCLTNNPSFGEMNDTLGLGATLTGKIYDMNDNPVTRLKVLPASPAYFRLHTTLIIDVAGSYHTKIFHRFATETVNHLSVRLADFYGWHDTTPIEPFELINVAPDTTVVQDIHLKDNEYVETGVKIQKPPQTSDLEFINYPNPFNASTNFFVKLPADLQGKPGSILIYNSRGQLVKDISIGEQSVVRWDGTDRYGSKMPSGMYHYGLKIDKKLLKSGSMILLK